MDHEVIGQKEWVSVSFTAPLISRRVQVNIEASDTVHVWILPEEELDNFSADEYFEYYLKRKTVTQATLKFKPDGGEDWSLVIENKHSFSVTVDYEVIW